MKDAYLAARSLGGNITLRGYAYLATSANVVFYRGNFPSRKLGKEIYAQVASIHGTKASLVSWYIARAVEEIWDHGDRAMLEQVLRYKPTGKPSPGEMILALANYIAEGEKTIV